MLAYRLAPALAGLFTLIGADSTMAMLAPEKLRCEYLENPLAVGTPEPRLSWIVTSDTQGDRQTAYRIVVASDEKKLGGDQGDLWDSGKVSSSETTFIPYGGGKLASGQRVFWKVKTWDKDGKEGPFSKPASWQMGLLSPSDWKAKWIGKPEAPPDPLPALPAAMLRREFDLGKPIRRAMLYATALGVYEVRLNGKRVGDHILAPEWTDYNERTQYQAYDVTDGLRSGANAVGAILGDGWYAGRLGISHIVKGGPLRGHYGRYPHLRVQIVVEHEDGSRSVIASDASWKATTEGPIRKACLLDGEVYDARMEQKGWDAPGFDDKAWKPVHVAESLPPKIVAQPNEPIRVTVELRPRSAKRVADNTYVFDFGQILAGWCRITGDFPEGTALRLRHAEMIEPDGNIYRDNLRMKSLAGESPDLGARQEDEYICRGGTFTWEPRFTYHGFRYVEVAGLPADPAPDFIVARHFHSTAPPAGSFECSDPLLNQLITNIQWTQRDNMHSTPTDCPQRDERMGWTGDILSFAQAAMFNMDMGAFFTKWLQDMRDDQADDGRFPDFAPHPYDVNKLFSGVPAWADAGVFVPWEAYVNYGDKRLLETHFESARRWVDYVHGLSPDLLWKNERGDRKGLRGNDYGDWLNGDTLKLEGYGFPVGVAQLPNEVLATAFFEHSTRLVAQMAGAIGRTGDAKKYGQLADDIRAAFIKAYIKEDGTVLGNTQSGYALTLDFNLMPEELRAKAAEKMVAAIEAYKGHISTGFHTTAKLMKELTRSGHTDVAYKLILNRTIPSWGYTIDQGATTIWERWDGYVEGRGYQDPAMNSFCHYSLGAVSEWMFRTILGINPDPARPGYRHVILRPEPGGGLTSAKGSYDSIRGPIASEWKLYDGKLTYSVTIPANVTATVYLPAADGAAVSVNGKPSAGADGVKAAGREGGAAVFEIGSGTYRFEAKQ